ncbi:MAG: hypothetical protein JWN29_2317 [Acidimicrobiales bacterium]|jgi:uncharacterized membrane protein (UPF0127 family)|nr:hypothetical protein [Acidimicrobiales bacterium]
MPWLCRDGEVLASAEVADTRGARRRGLLGCDRADGALVLIPARAVHSLGMRFDLDVAYLDADGIVLDVHRLRRHRVGLPRWRARSVVEAQAGAFARWSVRPGDRLEVR